MKQQTEIPQGHAHLQNGRTPAIYETVFRTLIHLADRIDGLVEDNWQIRWDMRPKRRCGKSFAHALRQVELREKRKALRKLHLELVG